MWAGDDRREYSGDWSNGKVQGEGQLKWANGAAYNGEWVDNKRHGAGTETSRWKIYRYQGEWSNDEKHGKVTVSWFWSSVECRGKWNEGELRGMPTCICRFVLLERSVEVSWHYIVEHHLDLVAVLGVWIGLWVFRRAGRCESTCF